MELFKYDTKLSVTTKLPLIFQGFLQCPFSVIRMHCGFADAEFFRRFPHRRICCDHEFRHFHRPFFDICLQTKHSSKYRLVMYMPANENISTKYENHKRKVFSFEKTFLFISLCHFYQQQIQRIPDLDSSPFPRAPVPHALLYSLQLAP